MPEWPTTKVGANVQRRVDPVVLEPDRFYSSLGIRWYGTGVYVRDEKPGRTIRTKMYRAHAGDFLYCVLDTQNGPFDIIPEELGGSIVTNKFPTYTVGPGLVPEYLRLTFQHPRTLELIGKARQGAEGRSEWKPEQFEAHRIPFPPKKVQSLIVKIMAASDSVRHALKIEIATAKAARAALLHQLLEALAPDVDRMVLRDVASWSSGGTPKADNPDFYGGGIPWAIIGDIRSRSVSATTRTISQSGLTAIGGKKKLAPAGAVLVSMYGIIGKCAVAEVPMATNQAICRGVANDLVSSEYLRLWISSCQNDLIRLGEGKTQMNINKKKIESFPIKVPDPETQDRIVNIMASVDDQIEALENESKEVAVARQALLDALLRGEVEIDPAPLAQELD